jgi:membrane fusion protein, heavy metal efflux system
VIVERRVATWAALCLPWGLLGCGSSEAPAKATAPAKVTAGVTEASLTTITLTADAVGRLGIETAVVEQRGMVRTRTVGGEVMPAAGAMTTVTAPVAGTLEAAAGASRVGTTLKGGTTVLRLVPLAPAERDVRVEAERAVDEAAGRQALAAQRLQRAARLASDGSGSRRAVEEAQAEMIAADAAIKAARDRLALAARSVSPSGALALNAPDDAMLLAVHAAPGQAVAAGARLFDLARLDPIWIRVAVFAGELGDIDRGASARIVPLGASGASPGVAAQPVVAPPTADAATAAVDLYYAAANAGGSLRPGQRVGVRVPLASPAQSLVVPRAAVLHDAYGGSWVYEARPSHAFVRRRVSVRDLVDGLAVLDQGPPSGTKVVTTGAAELFGTEFGVGK